MSPTLSFFTKHKSVIINIFRLVYLLIIVFVFWSVKEKWNGVNFGRTAIVMFVVVLLPGIARRFGVRTITTAIIMLFRRQLGITVYLLSVSHFFLGRVMRRLATGSFSLSSFSLFEIVGFSALLLLTPLFATSNDWSVSKLGKWWRRIHGMIYLVAWLIFFHVALQRFSMWSVIIGSAAVLEIASFLYSSYWKKTKKDLLY